MSQDLNSLISPVASPIILSASRFAALPKAEASRLLSNRSCSAWRTAFSRSSFASDSAASIYLRPRDSAPERIDFALASDESRRSLAIRAVSAIVCSAEASARDSRCCAVLIKLIAVSPARISNSSLLKLVMSLRERRSAS